MLRVVHDQRSSRLLSLVTGAELTDSDVARALIAGEPRAIGLTWQRFAPMVLTLSERCLGSRSEAEDIAQEVFFRVFSKAATLRDPDCLRSFIYSFALRVLKTELRRRKVRAWLSFARSETLEDLPSRAADVESRDLLRRFHLLLDRLAPSDRLAFVLRRMEHMTVDEIAAHMQVSRSTVHRCLARATGQLSRWVASDLGLAGLLERGAIYDSV